MQEIERKQGLDQEKAKQEKEVTLAIAEERRKLSSEVTKRTKQHDDYYMKRRKELEDELDEDISSFLPTVAPVYSTRGVRGACNEFCDNVFYNSKWFILLNRVIVSHNPSATMNRLVI